MCNVHTANPLGYLKEAISRVSIKESSEQRHLLPSISPYDDHHKSISIKFPISFSNNISIPSIHPIQKLQFINN